MDIDHLALVISLLPHNFIWMATCSNFFIEKTLTECLSVDNLAVSKGNNCHNIYQLENYCPLPDISHNLPITCIKQKQISFLSLINIILCF